MLKNNPELLKTIILSFTEWHKLPELGVGRYRYSLATDKPTLYSSAYAVMIRALLGDISTLSDNERREWIDYFIALGVWAVAIFAAYTAFEAVLRWLRLK